jgi:hypothetical protein
MAHTALTFDTLQYAKKLQKAGFTSQQAELQAELVREQTTAINDCLDNNLATKRDLKELEDRLTTRVNEMGYKLTLRLGGMMVSAVLVLGVLIPMLLKFVK